MNQQMKIGLFLAIGIFVIAISIFSLGSNKSIFQKAYTVHSYFDSVQGLNKGGIVSLAGVKIGNIENMDFDSEKNLVKVSFLITEDYINKIKKDSVVEIKTQGALGDKYLYITPGTEAEVVQNGAEMKSEFGNDLLTVISKRSGDAEKIFDAITELKILLKGVNDGNRIPNLIRKLDNTAGNLQTVSEQIKSANGDNQIKKSLQRMDNILAKVDNGEGTLGALINDKTLHNRLKQIFGAGEKQKQIKSSLKSSFE